jgi:hypothetical protein
LKVVITHLFKLYKVRYNKHIPEKKYQYELPE